MKQGEIKFVTGSKGKSWEEEQFQKRTQQQKRWRTIKTRESIRDINNQRKYRKINARKLNGESWSAIALIYNNEKNKPRKTS